MQRIHNTDSDTLVIGDGNRQYPQDYRENGLSFKPHGIWYSIGSEWVEWLQDNMPSRLGKHNYSLDVDEGRLLVIKDLVKLNEFAEQYQHEKSDRYNHIVDWRKVADQYAGIEIQNYHAIKWALTNMYTWFYAWDVSSGCIWDLTAIKNYTPCETLPLQSA